MADLKPAACDVDKVLHVQSALSATPAETTSSMLIIEQEDSNKAVKVTSTPWRVPYVRDAAPFTWHSSSPAHRLQSKVETSVFATSVSRIRVPSSSVEQGKKVANDVEIDHTRNLDETVDFSLSGEESLSAESQSFDPLMTILETDVPRVASFAATPDATGHRSKDYLAGEVRSSSSFYAVVEERGSGGERAVTSELEEEDDEESEIQAEKVQTTNSAMKLISEVLNAAALGETIDFDLLFPGRKLSDICDLLLDFFVSKLPAVLDSLADQCIGEVEKCNRISRDTSFSANASPRAATPRAPLMAPGGGGTTRRNSARKNAQQAPPAPQQQQPPTGSTMAAGDGRAMELRASIRKHEDELTRLTQLAIQHAADPVKRTEVKMNIKLVERLLLNDTLALTVAQAVDESSGKLRSEVNVVQQKVTNLESRQEARDEEDKLNRAEMAEMKKRIVQLEEESRAARAERREIWKVVDTVDNVTRKQSLVLHGLKPNEDAKLLLPESVRKIERVYQIGQPVTSPRGSRHTVLVHFDTVASCDEALEYLNSAAFDPHRSRVGYARNCSNLTRIGGSRMKLLGERFVSRFPGAIIKRGYIQFGEQKYYAFDFAMKQIAVRGEVIDVDAWVASCEEGEQNRGNSAKIDGRTVHGVRVRRDGANKRQRSPSPEARRREAATGPSRQAHAERRPGDQQQQRANPSRTNKPGGLDNQGAGRQRNGNALPPLDGVSRGGVRMFANGGFSRHGENRQRDRVIEVSGYPAYAPRIFRNRNYLNEFQH